MHLVTSIVLLSLALPAGAESSSQVEPAGGDLAGRVRQLVRQLDGDALADREAAEKELVKLGADVLGLLPPITSRTPAEVKERLGRVRQSLEKAAAGSVIEPTRVSLDGPLEVAAALQSLIDQTENRVVGFRNRTGTVNVTCKNVTYWEGLDQVLDAAELSINPFGGEPNALEVVTRPKGELPRFGNADYRGLFRFEAVRLETRRELKNPSVDTMRLTLAVSWEPRMAPIAFRQPLEKVEAISELGDPIHLGETPSVLNAAVASGISAVELAIPFELPDRGVRRIARLKGVLTALLPGRIETFEFTDLAETRNEAQRKAGVTVTFERLRKNLDLYEARMALRFDDAGDALASHRGWVYGNEAFLLDADGKRLENAGGHPTRQLEDEVGFAYMFELPAGPEGYKFVYKTPALILHVPVEYELREIRLP